MLDWILSWLTPGAKPELVTIQLVPEGSARDLPGFHHGGLTLVAAKGSTFGQLLENFNTYRGPDSQIHKLFSQDGAEIPLRTVITMPAICVVKKI
jgi:hypothetical protein